MRKAEINLDCLQHNAEAIRRLRPCQKILAYVKSNAYGHGLSEVVKALNDHVDGYGVVGLQEGLKCRQLTSLPVVVNASASDLKTLIAMSAHQLEPVVFSLDYLEKLLKTPVSWPRIWLKINTGMNRMGLHHSDVSKAVTLLQQSGRVKSIIPMTHLADSSMSIDNKHQLARFRDWVDKSSFSSSSYANSAAILESNDHRHGEWIRPGLLLYGWTPEENQTHLIDLKPVMSLFSQILSINHLSSGSTVGYGRHYVAKQPHLAAMVSFGYADGLPRQIHTAKVLLGEAVGEVIGLPSMDTACVYLHSKAKVGDWVEWFSPRHSLHHLAASSQTIPYEILTRLSERVERVYVKEYDKVEG